MIEECLSKFFKFNIYNNQNYLEKRNLELNK